MPNSRGWSVGVWPQRRPPPPRQCVWCMHFCCHTHTHTHRAGPPLRPARSIHAGQIDILCLAICFLRRCQKLNVPRNLSGSMGSKESVDVVFFFYFIFCVCMSNSLQLQSRMSGTYSNSLGRDTMDLWRGVRSHQVR